MWSSQEDSSEKNLNLNFAFLRISAIFFQAWTLDHVAEAVYLATRCQIDEEIENALHDYDGGNQDAIQVKKLFSHVGIYS